MFFHTVEALTPCLTQRLSPEVRQLWKTRYRHIKKYGIRSGFSVLTGAGWYTLIQEAAKDGIKAHSKRYIGVIFVNSGLTFLSAGLPLLTNATKIVKYSKACHSVCSAAWRAAHNAAEFPLIICDYALFGEYVPSRGEADYDLFSNEATDFMNEFTK